VKTGTVTGVVLDSGGNPVEGATVEIGTSGGSSYTAETGENGSFSLEVRHGSFDWRISKDGYTSISGSSYVGPKGVVELDLSESTLDREGERGPTTLVMVVAVVFLTSIILIILFMIFRKLKGENSLLSEE